eukprot:9127125-Pyramimonas_sp.AAC.1
MPPEGGAAARALASHGKLSHGTISASGNNAGACDAPLWGPLEGVECGYAMPTPPPPGGGASSMSGTTLV